MNPIKIIAQSDWLRLIFGGVFAGLAIYGLVHEYYHIAWIAVPVAVLIGAMSCFAYETMVEAVVKASIAALIVFVLLRTIPKMMAHEPDWRKSALVSLPLGFIGGMGFGSLLGGIFRLFWEPVVHNGEEAHTREKDTEPAVRGNRR
jgi:hypothetical protein